MDALILSDGGRGHVLIKGGSSLFDVINVINEMFPHHQSRGWKRLILAAFI